MTPIFAVLLISLPLGSADHHTVSSRTEVIHDLARLTPSEARLLEGKRAKYRLVLGSLPDSQQGFVLYECPSNDEVGRTIWLDLEQELAEEMIVEATLRIFHHPAAVEREGTPARVFTEYRLLSALRRF
jgi:hypothetical protein